MSRVAAIALDAYRETLRERILYGPVLFALLMGVGAYVLGKMSVGQEVKMIKDLGLAVIAIAGAAIAILLGVRLVSRESERRTLESVLAKPVSRVQFLLGRYLGLCLTLAVNMSLMAVGLHLVLLAMTGRFEGALLKAVYLTLWQVALVGALALTFNTFSSSLLSGIFTGAIYVAGHFPEELKQFETVVGSTVLSRVTTAVAYLLPNMTTFDIKGQAVHGDPVSWSWLALATVYSALYVSLALLLASVIFQRRDLA